VTLVACFATASEVMTYGGIHYYYSLLPSASKRIEFKVPSKPFCVISEALFNSKSQKPNHTGKHAT